MRHKDIKSLEELQLEMKQLKSEYLLKETLLKEDARAYIKQFSPMNLITDFFNPKSLLKLDEKNQSKR